MINQVYSLVSPRQFEVTYKDFSLSSDYVVVRPTHLSICAADQRYYTGSRGREVLDKKLPMALIHEGVGKVVYDPSGTFDIGKNVVMIPNTPTESDEIIAENYLRTSKFRSSGFDGFMQDYVFMKADRLVPFNGEVNPEVVAFSELVSVSMHAISRFKNKSHGRKNIFGVWGDGNLGFITGLLLRKFYPKSKIYVFGKNDHKLERFSFVNQTYKIDAIPNDMALDHAFECVGGVGSQYAIEQIIDNLSPEGTISLLGVSENPVEINTRMVLEKGITMYGSSRSGREDFIATVNILESEKEVRDYLELLIGSINEVRSIQDCINTFEKDLSSGWGKTIMQWNL